MVVLQIEQQQVVKILYSDLKDFIVSEENKGKTSVFITFDIKLFLWFFIGHVFLTSSHVLFFLVSCTVLCAAAMLVKTGNKVAELCFYR